MATQRDKVIFSDKKKFNLDGPDEYPRHCRRARLSLNEKLAPGAPRAYIGLAGVFTVSNPVENMWGIIVRHYNTIDDLKAAMLEAWDQIDDNTIQNLLESMPRRIFEVICNDGGPIDY
ncbi:hypothetical protein ANCDUO_14954 [Ancylostoma duodenale]|uniref:Uncharacterized protein n=1 Tax=Ancylostoma duodenale TaxID=51022 RepID=A0A0C2GCW9_9BILA|nr:hypothetical protein ANCDUO_14954 [Ancylostoma duodenale]